MKKNKDQVRIWNTYFSLAHYFTKELKKQNKEKKDIYEYTKNVLNLEGDVLPENEFFKLATILMCNLAIEARINHMIEEEKAIDSTISGFADDLEWMNTKLKWFLLPFYSRNEKFDSGNAPHQAICELCSLRNHLIHITNFDNLKKKLDDNNLPVSKVIGYYNDFIDAMFEMNRTMRNISEDRFHKLYDETKKKLKI